MKPENAIEVNHVTKSFKVYLDKGRTLKEKILFQNRRKYERRTVLDGISFEVKKGEAIGLIGQNGCGKSTTLKLLTRIMYPDSGTIEMAGRVSSLIELGAGFHPDMSGRQNIYINASIFGLSRKEIDARLNDIISFSELEEFIDNPVRTYSSGMYMRLAFSVAINVDADILLIDEILAVGDANFQAKCFNKLREIKAAGTTIVIVSHSLGQIEQICERSIWIQDGKIRLEGIPREVHPAYLNYMAQQFLEHKERKAEESVPEKDTSEAAANDLENEQEPLQETEKTRWGNGAVHFTKIRLIGKDGKEREKFLTGEKMIIEMHYQLNSGVKNPACGIGIFRDDGIQCYGVNTQIDHIHGLALKQMGTICFTVDANMLLPGTYTLDAALHTEEGFAYDYYRYAKKFQMFSEYSEAGLVRLSHTWSLDGSNLR